jgi:hypothetical protein
MPYEPDEQDVEKAIEQQHGYNLATYLLGLGLLIILAILSADQFGFISLSRNVLTLVWLCFVAIGFLGGAEITHNDHKWQDYIKTKIQSRTFHRHLVSTNIGLVTYECPALHDADEIGKRIRQLVQDLPTVDLLTYQTELDAKILRVDRKPQPENPQPPPDPDTPLPVGKPYPLDPPER